MTNKLSIYLADYIKEELERGAVLEELNEIIKEAIEAFESGAHDGDLYIVKVIKDKQ
jgi:hypothetical protein